MVALSYSASIVLDSLAGYLTVVSLIAGFSLVEKFLHTSWIPTSKNSLSGSTSQQFFKVDVTKFKPIECLFLYFGSYPITAAYRASWGSATGCFSLVVVTIGLLFFVESLIVPESIEDEESKDDTAGSLTSLKEKKKKFLGSICVSTEHVPAASPAASTPTMSNIKEQPPITPMKELSSIKKESREVRSCVSAGPSFRKVRNYEKKGSYDNDDDLDPLSKNTVDDDVPSVVTWDPAVSTGAGTDLDVLQKKRSAHRREQSLIEGHLIGSNLEPHYSNLIDSANAPIFGVDAVGRVNVWNKCAMRIVGYTPDEVMGKVSNETNMLPPSKFIKCMCLSNKLLL